MNHQLTNVHTDCSLKAISFHKEADISFQHQRRHLKVELDVIQKLAVMHKIN